MALIICPECGKEFSDKASACPNCGAPISSFAQPVSNQPVAHPGITCPKCGSTLIDSQLFQETTGSATVTSTTSRYKQQGHGCLWWLLIGWWWWIVDLFLWIFAFFPRLLFQIFRRKKYRGSAKSVTSTTNQIGYKTLFLCKNCGERWSR